MHDNWRIAVTATILFLVFAATAPSAELSEERSWGRDPFRYQGTTPTATVAETDETGPVAELLELKGIVLDDKGRYRALINGREYQAGELCNGVRIREINRFDITIEDADGTRKIELFHDR